METSKTKERSGITGKITIRTYAGGTLKKALALLDIGKKDEAKAIMREGYLETPVVQKNLIMQSNNYGMDIIIQRLVGTNTYSGNITYGEIGLSTTPVTLADTALGDPAVRIATTFSEDYGNSEAIVQFFFIDSNLPNQTYYEFGTFIDGSNTIGSGQLFNHALFGTPYVKIAGQDTTVECDFSFTQ